MNELTVAEIYRHDICLKTIKECESFVDTAIECMWKLSEAYLEIKENKLYRREGTLEDWCDKHSKFGHRRMQQIVQSSKTLKSLENTKHVALLTNPRQIDAISKAPKEEREAILDKLSKNGKVTAKAIKDEIKKEVIELDKTGYPIPDDVLNDWKQAEEVREFMTAISKIKCFIEKGVAEEGLIFKEVGQGLVADLQNCYSGLKRIIPHAVCICEGNNKKSCKTCKGRGFISDFLWSVTVPKDLKDIRKLIKK